MSSSAIKTQPHYPTPVAKSADLIVHVVGLTLALVGGIVLLTLAVKAGSISRVVGVAIYAAGLVVMLAFSTAYNFASPERRPMMRRLDQVGIFLMIAGSYTPFTLHLPQPWAFGLTTAVWSVTGLSVLGKLMFDRLDHRIWIGAYLALGWLVVFAIKPLIDHLAWYVLVLLLAGGLLYSVGVVFHINKRLQFARAIWHGHVVAAAATHWAAVLLGVVLATR
jgi:hemolysin III